MTEQDLKTAKIDQSQKSTDQIISIDEQTSPQDMTFVDEKYFSTDISLNYVLFWAVILGLVMNWLAMYLKISMGFVSVGIGPMAVLLIGRQILRRKEAASRQNLTVIIIAYGATQAAEASVGLLFLLWLATNSTFYGGLAFNPPWWLLPSADIIASRTVLSAQWIVPLLVHYFLMLIPGAIGLVFGWYMKDSFIHDEETYPFPGMISQNAQIGVLTDDAKTKGPLFWKIVRYSFVISFVTIIIPSLFIIDFSNLSSGFLFGIMLGPVGLALFGAGIIIGKPKLSITPFFVSVLAYSLISLVLFQGENTDGNDFYSVFNLLLQEYYFVPAIGIMLGGLILGPLVFGLLKSILGSKEKPGKDQQSEEDKTYSDLELNTLTSNESREKDSNQSRSIGLKTIVRKNYKLLVTFTLFYLVMIYYVQTTGIIPTAPLWMIAIMIFWNIILGGIVNGYLVTMGTAKSNSSIAPPFIFDVLPIFLVGGSGFTAYVAMPTAETDGSSGIVSSTKLAQMNNISENIAVKAYIVGYLATSLTTPIFALIMWRAFGIGTTSFPAPAFPVQGAILASFASRDVTSFINIQFLIIAIVVGIFLSRLGTDIILGLIIGLLFPPHMAITMALGGLTRVLIDKRYGVEDGKEKSAIIGPGFAVGASFVIPIMIALALLV